MSRTGFPPLGIWSWIDVAGLVREGGGVLGNECSGRECPLRRQVSNEKLSHAICPILLTLPSSLEP